MVHRHVCEGRIGTCVWGGAREYACPFRSGMHTCTFELHSAFVIGRPDHRSTSDDYLYKHIYLRSFNQTHVTNENRNESMLPFLFVMMSKNIVDE